MSPLKAGASKADITPDYPVWLDGNPRDGKSRGVHDPVSVRALVVESEEGPLALVSLDLCALHDEVYALLRRQLAEQVGIPVIRQVIACTHTHSAPASLGFFCPREDNYVRWLVPRVVEAVRHARQECAPVRVGWGVGEEFTISEYRRFCLSGGRIAMNWDSFTPEELIGPAGVMDPQVGVVRLDSLDGQVVALIYNHAGHPNTPPGTSFEISADYPGYASALIEKDLGGVALFTNGAQGSVDIPAFRERDWAGMARKGEWLAREVLNVARRITLADAPLSMANTRYPVAMRTISPEYLAWCRSEVAKPRAPRTIRDGVDEAIYAQLCLDLVALGQSSFQVEMTAFRLGEAAFVTFPGELFTEIGRRIKAARAGRPTFIVDMVNGYFGYVPTRRAIAEGGYESRPGIGSRLEEGAEDRIVEEAVKLLNQL